VQIGVDIDSAVIPKKQIQHLPRILGMFGVPCFNTLLQMNVHIGLNLLLQSLSDDLIYLYTPPLNPRAARTRMVSHPARTLDKLGLNNRPSRARGADTQGVRTWRSTWSAGQTASVQHPCGPPHPS